MSDHPQPTQFVESNVVLAMQSGGTDGKLEAERLLRTMSPGERRVLAEACADVCGMVRAIERGL